MPSQFAGWNEDKFEWSKGWETEEEKHKMNEERLAKVPRLRKEQGTEEDKVKERHMEGTRKVKGKCYEHHIDED